MWKKNIYDSLIETLLNIPRKTNDGVKARLNLVNIVIKPSLAPKKRGQCMFLPFPCHTLSRKKKTSFCECLHGVKCYFGSLALISGNLNPF